MANRVFYFFFAPTWDYPPGGPIKLGNVITSVKKPERPLYTAPLPTDAEVFSTEQRRVEFSEEKLRAGQLSIFTTFLSVLGAGVDGDKDLYAFDRLETTQFFPNETYLQKCIEAEPVHRYLDKSRYRKPIYVITGLKTVTGARAKSLRARTVSGSFGVEVDGTVWSGGSVPVGGGPHIGGKKETKIATSWEGSSDFVFAFRVRKVLVERKMGTVKKDEDYKTGAMLEDKIEEMDAPEFCIVTEEDPDAEEEGFLKEELMDGDAMVACAVPNLEGGVEDSIE
ncbi:hypothetical protein B7463_g888, partial [Scytalidium lignicola]